MKFVSFEYLLFLSILLITYWSLKKNTYRNLLILIASYTFYGFWDYRFLSLIFFSSLIDFLIANKMASIETLSTRKKLLTLSLSVNLGTLFLFKYFNFFSLSLTTLFTDTLGIELNFITLNLILPVGISFYTFQTLSYTIDVYRRKLSPTKNWIDFFSYVSFFPQLVAGPIERAINLLPQFDTPRKFDPNKVKAGLRQILWGVFKKVVIADNLGTYVDQLFYAPQNHSGSTLLLGAIYFSFQIYCDFSAYSDIAIGSAKLFGYDLMKNFDLPYFSRDIAEFWRRWHISLSTWFRDYVYISLGGNRNSSKLKTLINVGIVFLLSALWHGANWTFIIWGGLHTLLFLPYILTNSNRKHLDQVAEHNVSPSLLEIGQIGMTFLIVTLCWIFFRAQSLNEALIYLDGIIDVSLFSIPKKLGGLPSLLLLIIIEWFTRKKDYPFENWTAPLFIRWSSYIGVLLLIIFFAGEEKEFIYFQF